MKHTAYISPDFLRGALIGKISRHATAGYIRVNITEITGERRKAEKTVKKNPFKKISLKTGETIQIGDFLRAGKGRARIEFEISEEHTALCGAIVSRADGKAKTFYRWVNKY